MGTGNICRGRTDDESLIGTTSHHCIFLLLPRETTWFNPWVQVNVSHMGGILEGALP